MFEMLIGKNSNVIEGPPGVKFLGEVPTAGFINGLELASAIGLTAGTAQHSDSPWLHFVLDGKTLYVAKRTYRHTVSWDHINTTGAVFGTRRVTINGRTYKVRLLKSAATGSIYAGGISNVYDPIQAYGSEWNRLMYSVHSGEHTNANNPSPRSGEGLWLGTLAQYTDADADYNTFSWCQETPSSNTTARVYRGLRGVSYLNWILASHAATTNGWRPVLELVE